MSHRPDPHTRALRNGPPSPLLELGVSPSAGPSTRRRSLLVTSPMVGTTPSRTRRQSATSTPTNAKSHPAPTRVKDKLSTNANFSTKITRTAKRPTRSPVKEDEPKARRARQTSTLSDPNPSPLPSTSKVNPAAPANESPSKTAPPAKMASPRKPKAPEKRVLPARIRRTAGAGDGIRDLEDMIVDWLERYCEPCNTPPESLIIHLTTLPLHLVEPPISPSSLPTAAGPSSTPIKPSLTAPAAPIAPSSSASKAKEEERAKIEVPTWRMATSAEDDEEEAREEVLSRGVLGPRGAMSSVKRLRTAFVGHETMEDTSDAYYLALHKKYEVFERKQRLREKEKLQFERYKMRSRIDLLRTMSIMGWTSLVGTVLARPPPSSLTADDWERGKEKIKKMGADWLRDVLVREGQEVLERYDFLLPVEARKPKGGDSRTSTPAPSSVAPTPSVSPPPILNARVAALRDPSKPDSSKKRQGSPLGARDTSTPKGGRSRAPASGGSSGRKRKRDKSQSISPAPSEAEDEDEEDEEEDQPSGSRKIVRTYGRNRASRAGPGGEILLNGSNSTHPTPTIIKTRPSRSANPTPPASAITASGRATRRNLLSPAKLGIAPRSNGSSISPDEIRDMREVEAAVVI